MTQQQFSKTTSHNSAKGTAQLLDGKILSGLIKEQLKIEVAAIVKEYGSAPALVNLMFGDNPSARAYANSQKKAAGEIGIEYRLVPLPETTPQQDLIKVIKEFNRATSVNGIMIHKPTPKHIDYGSVANLIDPAKDLEGINVANIGRMMLGETHMIPCTPAAVMEHIKSTKVALRGKEAVIVGRSEIVGKPLIPLLLGQSATVTVCHFATSEAGKLIDHVGRADVLVVAVGKAHFIKGKWIKKGAIVIDVGINQLGDKIVGDVEFEAAQKRAAFITPVPGGVGPVTVVMLMKNGIEAFRMQRGKI